MSSRVREQQHTPEIWAAVYDHYTRLCLEEVWSQPNDSYEKVFQMVHDDMDEDAE